MPNTKAEERKMDCELTSVSHGSHDDSHGSLARCLSRPVRDSKCRPDGGIEKDAVYITLPFVHYKAFS